MFGLAERAEITGGVESSTVTVVEQLTGNVFPSVTMTLTVCVPAA
jgi:hypothetical protein